MNSAHEKILIEGLKEGNVKIFDYVFHYYYSGMVVFASKYVNDYEAAEDIVQSFFVKIWIKRDQLNITSNLKSYMFSSLKNSCIDYLRKQNLKDQAQGQLFEELKNRVDFRNLLIESELRDQINQAIDKLSPVCKEVFLMNRFEGLKPAEIADKKNISIRTVEKHIGKALKKLRSELSTYLPSSLLAILLGCL